MAQQKNIEVTTGTPMKKRKTTIPKEKIEFEVVEEIIEQKPVEKNITAGSRTVGKTTQTFAQAFNFAELKNILMQNVGKSSNRTFVQYSKERLQTYLTNPASNIDNIRDISAFLYRVSQNYKTLINYYSLMPLYSYNSTYITKDWAQPPTAEEFMKNFQEVCKRLDNMNLRTICPQIISTTMRDGVCVGYVYDDEDSFFINFLDPKYCKISALADRNTYIVKFDASYFDVGNNKEFLYGVNEDGEGAWDEAFITGYEEYKNNGAAFKWFELPVERVICTICGDDPTLPLPYFLNIFNSLLDLLDYEALIRSKTELENYVLLVSKIPLLKNSDQVNDFAVDLDLVRATQAVIDEVAPQLAATCFTPCEIEPIFLTNKNQVDDTNIYAEAMDNLFSTIGVSKALFAGESNSVGLRHSIRVDESIAFNFLRRIEANIQRYIKLNVSEDFSFKFHEVTIFGADDYKKALKEEVSLGSPKKLDWATIDKSPLEVMNSTFMEDALGLVDVWKPLSSSFTQSSESGGQEKSEDDLSPEGIETRDQGKNETTKSGK